MQTIPGVGAASSTEAGLLARLRTGDELAFQTLVRQHHSAMTRVARSFVSTPAIADEVVQETWLAVISGLDGFEGRSTLKTWIFRILVNRAKTRGVREQRTMPFSSLMTEDDEQGPTVDPDRFLEAGNAFAGYWSIPPSRFFELPEEQLLAAESRALVGGAISQLPERQREVMRLRDVEGWEAAEVCENIGISEANQRVLLHRARAKVRAQLEAHFSELVPA